MPQDWPGEYFGGTTAVSHRATVRLELDRLVITETSSGEILERWPLPRTRWISGEDKPVLSSLDTPDARLVMDTPTFAHNLLAQNPDLKGRLKTPKTRATHAQAWKLGAAAVGLVAVFLLILPWLAGPLAGLVPEAWWHRLGAKTTVSVEKLFGNRCTGVDGQAALDQLTSRFAAQLEKPEKLTVSVIDHKMINAFALPGGHILIMRGLIEFAKSGGEVAGVLSHEIGHVALDHAEQLTFRQMGHEILLSTIADAGTVTELAANTGVFLVDAAHSRSAESAADVLALELMRRAGIRRQGLATFFKRIQKMEFDGPDFLKYFSTHPASTERELMAEAKSTGGRPAFDPKAWQALRKICG